jgi:hypothetical protein
LGTLDGHVNSIMDLAFSPDGKTLASASSDTTVLIWEMTGLLKERGERLRLSAGEVAKCWDDLASADAFKAYQAVLALANVPDLSVPLLRERLHPVSSTGPQGVTKQIQDLDSGRFADRENASRALEALGELAVPELEATLRNPVSAEVRRRIESILEKARAAVIPPDVLRAVRAVEVLDRIGTKEARAILASLAQAPPTPA